MIKKIKINLINLKSIILIMMILFSGLVFSQKNIEVYADNDPEYNAVFIGDENVLELSSINKDEKNYFYGEDRKGLTWLKENNENQMRKAQKGSNLFYMIGFNEVQNTYQAESYANYLNEVAKANSEKNDINIYYVSVLPANEDKYKSPINQKIDAWNKVMNEKLSADVKYIDVNSVLKKNGYDTLNNGYLPNEENSQKILDFLLKQAGLLTYAEKVEASKPKPKEIVTKNGWGTDKEGKRVYYNENKKILKSGMFEIDGAKYLMDDNGHYKTGLQKFEGYNYYFNSVGVMKSGWVKDNDKWMLFAEKGPQLFGWQSYGDDDYYIGKDGSRLTGWWNLGTTLHYFDENGRAGKGITRVEGDTYYFVNKGVVKVGWIEEGGNNYYFGEGGPMVTGKQSIGGSTYFFSDDGKMYKGFNQEKDGIRYYGEDGSMVTGFVTIDGVEYKFDDGGLMETGYVKNSKGETKYFTKDGKLANGVVDVDGVKTLFKDGEKTGGWHEYSGKKYYFDDNGEMVTKSWRTIDGKEYYFDENGEFLTGKHKFDGYRYKFDDNGVLISKTRTIILPLIIILILLAGGAVFAVFNKELVYDLLGDLIEKLGGDKQSKVKTNKKVEVNKTVKPHNGDKNNKSKNKKVKGTNKIKDKIKSLINKKAGK